MGRYEERINLRGETRRERELYRLKNAITQQCLSSLSCKSVTINDVSRYLMIDAADSTNVKSAKTLPGETLNPGEYIVWDGNTWLVIEAGTDNEIYGKGKIQLCNYIVKFQSSAGDILSYPCIDEDATGREDENVTQMLTTGSSGHTITLPLDEITVLLKNGQRFFVDNNAGNPKSFKVVGINNTSSPGLVVLTVKESERQTDDRIDLGVCDYFEVIPTPDPVDPEVPTVVVTMSCNVADFANKVKLGLTYIFTPTVTNELGVPISNATPSFTVSNNYGGLVSIVINEDGTINLKVPYDAYSILTKQFTLTCTDTHSGFSTSALLTIVGRY